MRLERDQEFWQIELAGGVYTIRTGRIGTHGQSERHACGSAELAQRGHDDAIAHAREQGFVEPMGEMSTTGLELRNPALEAALRDDHDDREAFLVYADWLQAAGNPFGELVALAVRTDGAPKDPDIVARIDWLRASLRLPVPEGVTYVFRWGLFESLRIQNFTMRPTMLELLPPLFGHVMCAALDELRIGGPPSKRTLTLAEQVIDEAGKHAWAAGLRRLHVGRDDPSDPKTAFRYPDFDAGLIGARISQTFPRLERLRVQAGVKSGGAASSLEDLDLPHLRELVVLAGWFGEQRYHQLVTMNVPALERLELWLPASPAARPADPTQLHGLFANRRFETVRDLALRNSHHADAFAAAIPEWPIAATLETLDLSWGTLSDDGARALLVNPRKLRALQHLVVDRSYVSQEMVRALAARYPRVSANDQRSPTTASQRVIYRPPGYY